MYSCNHGNCKKTASFYCDCGESITLLCDSCVHPHKKPPNIHEIRDFKVPSKESILTSLILQLKHCEQEIIKSTQLRLKEINDQCTKSIDFLYKTRYTLIETFKKNAITNDFVAGLAKELTEAMCIFYAELYKYTLEEDRQPDLVYEYDGGLYNGKKHNERPHGTGTMFYKNGESYEGEFKEGRRAGLGIYYFSNGDVYKGEWKDSKRNGKGELVTGEWKYKGYWKENKKEGYGSLMHFKGKNKGYRYEGKWENDLKHGMGIEYFDKERFEGEFVEDLRHGMFIHYFENGESAHEIWNEGEIVQESQ